MRLNEAEPRPPLTRYLPDWLRRAAKRLKSSTAGPAATLSQTAQPMSSPETACEIEALVVRIYELALGRKPSPDERQLWANQVLHRHSSVAGIVAAISNSPEASAVRKARQESAPGESTSAIEALVVRMYQLALGRTPNAEETHLWARQVLDRHLSVTGFVETIATSPEAELFRARAAMLPDVPNGRFVQFAYEHLLGRSAMANEIAHWDYRIAHKILGRDRLVTSLFAQHATEALTGHTATTDPSLSHVMGTDKLIDIAEWRKRADSSAPHAKPTAPKIYSSLAFQPPQGILVSAIASLYRGGDYIDQFLENITSQTIFGCCELIIIDADSPENESTVIASYMERFPNIVYHRAATRIGIYEAWNLGVQLSRGRYLTNTNLDDLRRHDSFERQVEILEKFPFVDVAYQDFYYSFEGKASFSRTAAAGVKSEVPIVTPYNLVQSNAPHNAPMWRRALHDDMGLFDASYRSAGDHDFWLRCVRAGKVFYKINDPHIAYFVNPKGLSTKPDTRGIEEGIRTTREHGRALLSPKLLSFDDEFLAETSQALGAPLDLPEADRSIPEWRYAAAQRALRLWSVASRGANTVSGVTDVADR